MKSKLINESNPKIYALIFESGDSVMEEIKSFLRETDLKTSQLSGIGAFSKVQLGFFDFSLKDYKRIDIQEQLEVLSLNGDITLKPGGGNQVHVHVVVGKSDGSAHGGHLLSAIVHPTLEVILTETPAYLQRKVDQETGLSLIDLEI